MTAKNTKTKIEYKAAINDETVVRDIRVKKRINPTLLRIIIFLTSVLLIISTYAWLSVSLNVKVKFLDLIVSSDSGLFVSLDGIDYSDSVVISLNSVITDLKSTYPNHTNQWAAGGLWPVSSNGIRNLNSDKFDIYIGEISRYRRSTQKFLTTKLIDENKPSSVNLYIAFDLFLKNVSGSPKSDNLYLKDTFIDFADNAFIDMPNEMQDITPEEIKASMSGIMNSMRFGIVKIGSVPSKTNVNTVQNLTCNNNCEMVIYEPNHNLHSDISISKAQEHGITLVDGIHTPTYAVIKEGTYLEHKNGQEGSGIEFDTEHFALQKTITDTDMDKPIFQIPNGVTKLRVYVWIEGQDIDSLETNSKGADIFIMINFEKDLAGYE